ncbi:unnamed protein product [Phytophthora lilii]|uniref:Unnamed protein product n=1 Tax=Phytophthora lilii TaxID=2077276 RepID=A0A9W6TJN5_9STRA|nr:unnamed protein product [Phytophthora lilii]
MPSLQGKYNVKDLSDVNRFLGMRVRVDTKAGITTLDQAQYAQQVIQRFSMSGCRPLYWHTKRQRIVSKSSTIAEYLAADDAVEEARWIQMLVSTLLKSSSTTPIPTMIDNKSTIKRLSNGKNSEAQKTVDCKFFAIRDAIRSGELAFQYCPTNIMLADGLTKALPTTRFRELRNAVGMASLPLVPHTGGEVLEYCPA